MIANDSQHLIQLAETGVRNDSNVACERTFDRIERIKAEEAMQPKPATEIEHPWVAELRAEDAEQEAARQAKIAAGKLVVHQNGYTEVLPPRW